MKPGAVVRNEWVKKIDHRAERGYQNAQAVATAGRVEVEKQKLVQLLRKELDAMAREKAGKRADPSAVDEQRRALSEKIKAEVLDIRLGFSSGAPTVKELATRVRRLSLAVMEVCESTPDL